MTTIFQIFRVLFVAFLIAFLIGGATVIVVQTIGVFLLSEAVVTGATQNIAPWAFVFATLCAVSAFVLRYSPENRAARDNGGQGTQ